MIKIFDIDVFFIIHMNYARKIHVWRTQLSYSVHVCLNEFTHTPLIC